MTYKQAYNIIRAEVEDNLYEKAGDPEYDHVFKALKIMDKLVYDKPAKTDDLHFRLNGKGRLIAK